MTASSPDAVSVLTLNVRFGNADDGPNDWSKRKAVFPEALAAHPVDFYAFQEVMDFQADYLKSLLPGYGCIGARVPAPSFWQHNLIFYKKTWTCDIWEHFFLSPTPDVPSRFRDSRWPRQCSLGAFHQNSRRLVCVTAHFDFLASVQNKSARLILEKLSRFGAETPTAVMGDFNTTPGTECHDIWMDARFQNAFAPPHPGTYHEFTGTPREHIDWILFRGGLVRESARVIRTPFGGRYPSDHFPVTARFRFR